MSREDSIAQRILALAGILALLGAAIVVAAHCSGCSGAGDITPSVSTSVTP